MGNAAADLDVRKKASPLAAEGRNRISVLALVPEAFGGRGGIAQYNRDFLRAVAQIPGVGDVKVMPRLAPDPPESVPANISLHEAGFSRLSYALRSISACLRQRPDVVFCGHVYHGPLAWALARATGAKLICQTHGTEVWRPLSFSRRRALEGSDLVLAVSRHTRKQLLLHTRLPANKICVLPNTVADDFTPGDDASIRARFGLMGRRVLLTVGRLDQRAYKGHDKVIAALPNLCRSDPSILYVIAGDGPDRPRLEVLARQHGVSDKVLFLGQIDRAELPGLYRAADLFVMPSVGEGFGIVYLEAMASGTPALGLNVGGVADAMCDGELGALAEEADFVETLHREVFRARPHPADLAAAVRTRFGAGAFRARVKEIFEQLNEHSG